MCSLAYPESFTCTNGGGEYCGKYRQLSYKNKIELYDIDGCICENFFPNLNENADINELKHRILKTQLNKDFVNYYRKSNGLRFFVTGRRFKDFGYETLKQLEELNIAPEQIIFYPDNYSHTKVRYNTFKIYNVLRIAVQHKHAEVVVYDDLNSYYPKLNSLGVALGIGKLRTIHVKDQVSFWRKILIKR